MNRCAMLRPVTLIAAAMMFALAACSPGQPVPPPLEGTSIGGDFSLIDKAQRPVRFHDFAGKYRIVYFGYTFCPDACPLDVQKIMQGYAKFAKAEPEVAARVQPLFISIDPARDTPAAVGEFAAAFSPKRIGLTGGEAQVAEAAKMFKAFYSKGEPSEDGDYLMDHSRVAYLMDPQGKPLALLSQDAKPEVIAGELSKWVK